MEWSKEYGVNREAWEKFDGFLRQAVVDARGSQTWDAPVMIVLAGEREPQPAPEIPRGRDRAQRIAERASGFERETTDLIETLAALGARDVETFWINRTISARLNLRALDVIGRREEVKQIMLVRKLQALI